MPPFSGGVNDHQHSGSGDGGSIITPTSITTFLPTGTYIHSAITLSPTAFKKCDGAAISQATFAALFAIIGIAFGNPGGGNYNLPDYRGRSPIGVGTGAGLTARALGASLGQETHPITVAEMPAHGHTERQGDNVPGVSPGSAQATNTTNNTISSNDSTASQGSGTAANVIHPVLAGGEWYIKT